MTHITLLSPPANYKRVSWEDDVSHPPLELTRRLSYDEFHLWGNLSLKDKMILWLNENAQQLDSLSERYKNIDYYHGFFWSRQVQALETHFYLPFKADPLLAYNVPSQKLFLWGEDHTGLTFFKAVPKVGLSPGKEIKLLVENSKKFTLRMIETNPERTHEPPLPSSSSNFPFLFSRQR